MTYVNKKYTALGLGAAIVLFLWTAHFFSFFSLSNGYGYDLLMRSFASSNASEDIIVIEMDSSYAEQGDEVWLALLKQLLASDAKQIAFTFLPKQASAQFYQMAVDSQKTVFGAHIVKSANALGQEELVLPKTAQDKKIVYGLISTAPSQHGVFRKQHSVVKANGIRFPGFEKRVAQQVLVNTGQLPETDFRINFTGNQNRIPRIRIERVLSGGLVSELVSGRTVLVGINQHQQFSQYYTPVSTNQQMTSEVMFHAFALDTLISDRQISDLPAKYALLLIFLITAASLFLCQWLAFKKSMTVSMLASLIYVVISWLTLHAFYIWLPLTELLLAQWLSVVIVWCFRVNQEHQNLDQMLSGFSLKLREMVKPVSIYSAEEPWEQLIAIINQSLQLNRLIFLERVPGDHRLKEIKALNCSIDDIREKRRDYERTPYSTAITENRPILLDRDYLEEVSTTEEQYIAPLIFGGEVLGFWIYTIEPKKIQSRAKFNTLTRAFMVQISEILHYRQEWQISTDRQHNKLGSYLRVEGTEHLQQLNQFVTLMDKRIFELQGVFNSINSSCILYDLFGKVIMVNADMDAMAQEANLRLFNMNMLEFIVEISGFDESASRNMIQRVIFDHESISIPVTQVSIKRSFMLHIRPLHSQDEKILNQHIPDESQVFQISGVLCELVDMTELKRLYQLKETMFERYNHQIRNDLSSIVSNLPVLDNQQTNEQEKQLAIRNIRGKIDTTLNMLGQVSQQMEVEIEHMLSNKLLCYPVDGRIALQKAIAKLQSTLEQREIKMHLQLPELISLVFASPLDLEVVIHAVLLAMIEDTYDADVIWVEVEEKDRNLIYHIHNNGIGISGNQLENVQNNQLSRESELLNFHNAVRCVNRWGGSLNITSEIGEGSKAELILRCFL